MIEMAAQVAISMPIKAECSQCGEVFALFSLSEVAVRDMAMRQWSCDGCQDDEVHI